MTFSNALAPSGVTMENPPLSSQKFQSPGRYAFYSRQGEPLEMTITTGVLEAFRGRPAAQYTITDAAGKVIADGRLALDGEQHPLKIPVPAAGPYWMVYKDSGSGWQIDVPAGRPASLALSLDYTPNSLGGRMPRMYFFVPKGTKQVQYFCKGILYDVNGPDGKKLKTVSESGKYITVDVPAGADGKVWSFNNLAIGDLYFCNIPNYIAVSPDALLVPREVLGK